MQERWSAVRECGGAMAFGAVGVVGFLVDVALLRIGVALHMSGWLARAISLFCGMQATFLVNGLLVFRRLTWTTVPRQWISYMATNGFGNLCNYWLFVTLISLHRGLASNYYVAMCAGGCTAWAINYSLTRLFVFGRRARPLRPTLDPAAGALQPPPVTWP